MSTSGTYNYWPKVNHPDKMFIQMESGGSQKPFFFGGSQVPLALGINGSGISMRYHEGISGPEPRPMYKTLPIRSEDDLIRMQRGRTRTYGKGLDHNTLSLSDHNDKIYIPRHLSSLHK
jgi:hypothetical protein